MSLRIRQIVVAARDLESTVSRLSRILGVRVCYRDPGVAEFGLVNALMAMGDQFLEVVSPNRPETAAGRHLERYGDSPYMLLLQTDDFPGDRDRLQRLGVRTIWESPRADIRAVHLHPKDIGGAIVSLDQPEPPEDWPWAGSQWRDCVTEQGARKVLSVTLGARDPVTLASRWAEVLGTSDPARDGDWIRIGLTEGELRFESADNDRLIAYTLAMPDPGAALAAARTEGLDVNGQTVMICGTRFELVPVGY